MKTFARLLLVFSLSSLLVPVAAAVTRADLDDARLAATIDGAPLTRQVLAVMVRVAEKRTTGITENAVLTSAIEDRLMAAHALTRYTPAQLMNDNKVAFRPEVNLRDQLVANLRAAYTSQLEAAVAKYKGLKNAVVARQTVKAADWLRILGPAKQLQLEYSLTEEGYKAANAMVLMRYRFDAKHEGKITFADVYDTQNVQGRNRLHQRDAAFAEEAAQQLLGARFVLYWVQNHSGLSAEEYASLETAVRDRAYKDGFLALLGVSGDMHKDNAHLREVAEAVTPTEIRSFYEANKEDFRRIEKVRARHISLPDIEVASAVYNELKKGADFAAVAKARSLADDRVQGGDLGWITHDDKQRSWLESVAYTQKVGVLSKPFRSPAAPGQEARWEIVLVDERVEGYQAPDSESVRYVAAQLLARKKVMQEYQDLRARLFRDAAIRINPALMPAKANEVRS